MDGQADQSGRELDGRYRILSRLGQGGMGAVYVAEHIGLGQRRAIKFIHADLAADSEAVKRFLREARVVSALRHDHIIAVLDLGHVDGSAYYVMELLDGEDLRATLRREGPLPWARVRAIALQVCSALTLVHGKGVVHRDLKPANCFCVARDDGADDIKLLDFGIAKLLAESGDTPLTATGAALGTAEYMAPEQIEGRFDHRADLYALGVMMYELLSGRKPRVGSAVEIISSHMRGAAITPLREHVPDVAPEIEALIRRSMAADPAQRFPDAKAMAAAIAAIPPDAPPRSSRPRPVGELDGNAETVPSPPASDAPREAPTHRAVAPEPPRAVGISTLALALSAATTATLVAVLWSVARREPPAEPPAPVAAVPADMPSKTLENVPADMPSAPSADVPENMPESPPPTAPASPPATPQPQPAPPAQPDPPPADEPARPAAAPKTARPLARDALAGKLTAALDACRPDRMSEEITLAVTPKPGGQLQALALQDAANLRARNVECVQTELRRFVAAFKARLADTTAFTLKIRLASKK